VFWATSSRENASLYEDGEIQNLYLRLERPLVLQSSISGLARVVMAAYQSVRAGKSDWDGVIVEDVVDGSHPSVIYAVFPQASNRAGTVSDRVRIVGRTNYDEESGKPAFTGLQPPGDPRQFGRGDEIRHDIDWQRQQQKQSCRAAISEWAADRTISNALNRLEIDVGVSGGCIQVKSLRVEPGNRGNCDASLVMRALMHAVDKHGAQIELEVGYDDAGIGLVDWYDRLGFVFHDGRMRRMPGVAMEPPTQALRFEQNVQQASFVMAEK